MRLQNPGFGLAAGIQHPETDENPLGDLCIADTSTSSWGKAPLERSLLPPTLGSPQIMQILAQNKRVEREKFSRRDRYQAADGTPTKIAVATKVYRSSGTERIGNRT